MPRMPYPHCDQSCQNKPVSNASDNIKLKILEDKLRNDFVEKDLTNLPGVSEVKSSDYLYIYDSEQEQVKKISANEILNQVDLDDYAKKSDLFNKDYNELENKPELFSGNYEDLSNKPIIPSIEGLATKEFVKEEIKNSGHMTIANLQIGVDFITDIKVGYLDAGFEVKATMTFGELLKRILLCEHEWLDATCTTPKTCNLCGKTEGEALRHIDEIIEGKEATCEETGLTDGIRCSRCGDILVQQQVIPALGHNYAHEVIKQATCTEEGLRKYTCTRCEDTYEDVIPVISHKQANREENRVEPDCTNNGSYEKVTYCIDCGEVLNRETIVLSCLGHDYGDWVITKQPEVGVEGQQQKICKRCGDVISEIIPALPEPEKPSIPGIPEDSVVGNLIANSIPAFSGTTNTGEEEVAFEILDTATAIPTDQGLYVTYDKNNEATAIGYQLTMEGNADNDAQTFAVPIGATIKRAWQYDEMGKSWIEYFFPDMYWLPGEIVTRTIDGVTYEYQLYTYNVEDMDGAITNDEYWRFEMEVNN